MFTLRAYFSDGFKVDLPGEFRTVDQASAAASRYMADYSDPCGLGVHVESVAIVDQDVLKASGEADGFAGAWASFDGPPLGFVSSRAV